MFKASSLRRIQFLTLNLVKTQAALLFLSLFFLSCQTKTKEVLRIACASNMTNCAEELIESWNLSSSIETELIIGSSGKLCSQITNGAPFHVFISADTSYTNTIYRTNFGQNPEIYGYGTLVIWTNKEGITLNERTLSNDSIIKIAIANPQSAPYGEITINYLKNNNLLDKLQHKLIYGESISQVNQYVVSKSVDIGITAKSSVFQSKSENKGKWIAISDVDPPILAQSIQVLNFGNKKKEANEFMTFMFSLKGTEILKKHGYIVP